MRSRTSTISRARARLAAALLLLAALLLTTALLAGCAPARTRPGVVAFDPDTVADAFARPSAALFEAGATRGFCVRPDGSLDDGAVLALFAPSSGGAPASLPHRIAFEDRWRPVAHWRRTSGAVRFDFEAVAIPHNAPRDTALWASVVVTATNTGAASAEAALDVTLSDPETREAFVAFDRGEADRAPVFEQRGVRTARAWSDAKVGGERASWRATLAPGAVAATRVVLSSYTLPAREFTAWAARSHEDRVADARRSWDTRLARGARFELNDPDIERALRGAFVVLLSCRERRGAHWLPMGGPFHYRDVWLRDGARVVNSLAVGGFGAEALALARGLSALQWDNGAFISQRGQLDGLGQAPWAFAQAALRASPDTAGVALLAESALRTWRYRQDMRALAVQAGWPLATMLPTAEPRDCELTRAQLTGNDAWALAGSVATARLLRAAGRAATAESVEASVTRDAAEFRAALARTGRADVPPSWQGRGLDWGNLATGWPCRALPADDAHLAVLAERVWAFGGHTGLAAYNGPDSLHGYVGADLGTWALLAGRRADADRVLDALLEWRNASGAGVEIIERHSHDFSRNLPPHPTTAAALVAQVRNSLLYDDDDTLRVGLGARTRWWQGARVHGAPTRWGRVDLSIARSGDVATWTISKLPVWSELVLPPDTELAAEPDAPLVAGADRRRVFAPPGTTLARVSVRAVSQGVAP